MTRSTNSKKSNGLQGDLLSGEWHERRRPSAAAANTYG